MKTDKIVRRHTALQIGTSALCAMVLCALSSCTKSETDDTTAPGTRISYSANTSTGEDDEMTARENFMLRLDAEAGGNYSLSDEKAVGAILSFASGGVGIQSDVQPLSSAGINIREITPLRNGPAMLAATDDRAPVPPVVVKFDGPEGEGFAVCSGDKRYEKVFCYVPKGDIADTTRIEMLKHFYRSVEYDINDSIARFNAQVDSLHVLGRSVAYSTTCEHGNTFPDGMFCMGEEYIATEQSENYIGMKLKWIQDAPYNNQMPSPAEDNSVSYVSSSNGRAVAGCATIALGQSMAFKKYNIFPYITPAMWNDINNRASIAGTANENAVATFINELSCNLRRKFVSEGTSITNGNMYIYLDSIRNVHGINFEYITSPKYTSPQEKETLMAYFSDAAKKKDPLTISAGVNGTTVGHAFVVDGTKYSKGELYEVVGTETEGGGINKMYRLLDFKYYLWVDCNWGWGGDSDGLYDYSNLRISKYNYTFTPIKAIFRLK